MNEGRLTAVLGFIDGIVLEFDADARYLDVRAANPALLAAPPAQLIGRTINEVLGPDVGAVFTAVVRRVSETGVTEHLDYPLEISGVPRWFVADVSRVDDSGGGSRVVMLARDVTEHRRTQEALVRSEERYRLAAQATNDVLWDHDFLSDQIEWSASIEAVMGYRELRTDGDWWRERLHPDDLQRVLSSLKASIEGEGATWSASYRFRRSDGAYGDFIDRSLIVRDASGTARRGIGSMMDVTQLNVLRAQLLHADRLAAVGLLAAGIGHEINNPLTYVVGNLDLALESLAAGAVEDRAGLVAALTEAHEGTLRIVEIVKNLKSFSDADDGKLGPVDVNAALERAIRMAEGEIRPRARIVRVFERIPATRGSESQLGQVFLNLLVNAAQAIEEGAKERNEIRIATGVDPRGRVYISVSDTGRGMSPERLLRIFDPFFTTRADGSGSGLGLSISQRLVQRAGGELTVESEVGKGTTFHVFLQAEGTGAAPAGRGNANPSSGEPRPRVLVIDDEPAVRRIVARLLEREADVLVVASAREALAHLEAGEQFALILCDVMMPEMTGIDFYDAVRENHSDCIPHLYFMTGGSFTPRSKQFLESMEGRCIDKPLNATVLRDLVRKASA